VPLLHFYVKQRHFDPLWALPNVFITPYIAGSTPASVRSSLARIRAQVERFCAGEPLLNMITGEC
jgi:phosphoglycerate dehydrogenase-like enzyme